MSEKVYIVRTVSSFDGHISYCGKGGTHDYTETPVNTFNKQQADGKARKARSMGFIESAEVIEVKIVPIDQPEESA